MMIGQRQERAGAVAGSLNSKSRSPPKSKGSSIPAAPIGYRNRRSLGKNNRDLKVMKLGLFSSMDQTIPKNIAGKSS